MTRDKSTFRTSLFIFIAVFLLCESVIAKKVPGYIPPPYFLRFFISVFTLAPIGLLVGVLSYYSNRHFDRENCIKNKNRFSVVLTALIFTGAITGALDGLNDELWNPAMIGSVSLSLIFPSALLILNNKIKFLYRLIISFIAIVPCLLIIGVLTYFYQDITFNGLGWPTMW